MTCFESACCFYCIVVGIDSSDNSRPEYSACKNLLERDASVKHTLGCLWYVLQKITRH